AADAVLYYRHALPSASLAYDSDDAANVQGEFYQLGINARELTDAQGVNHYVGDIRTLATYDISRLGDAGRSAESMKITLHISRKDDYTEYLDIYDYLVRNTLVLQDKNGNSIKADAAVSADETTDPEEFVYIISDPQSVLRYDADSLTYQIPVLFSVYTGRNGDFEELNKYYSNYMVSLEITLYTQDHAVGEIGGSAQKDHVIYTNAKLYSDVVGE
ncbi:MAG: hypothetical protein J6Z35_09275, partial [Lachnospiraceae bacterium]|nr:hypothetical protein [Lachnospiraceae bacterium]